MARVPLAFARLRELPAVFAGMAATSVITGKSGSLFVACMLLIVGSGSTIPWEPRWQAAFNIVPVLALAVGAPYSRDGFNDFQWVEILTAIVFGQVTNLTLAAIARPRGAAWPVCGPARNGSARRWRIGNARQTSSPRARRCSALFSTPPLTSSRSYGSATAD
jgi:hypothetical protein